MQKPNTTINWIPDGDATKIVEPSIGKQSAGWEVGERPPSQYFNFFWNTASAWINWLDGSKIDFNDDLESFLGGVEFSDVGNLERSTLLGYQCLDGTFNEVIAIGYNAISSPIALSSGSTVIGVNATSGIDLTDASLVFGYNGSTPFLLNYAQEYLSLDSDLQLSDGRSISMSAFSENFVIEGIGSFPNYYMKIGTAYASVNLALSAGLLDAYLEGGWGVDGFIEFINDSYIKAESMRFDLTSDLFEVTRDSEAGNLFKAFGVGEIYAQNYRMELGDQCLTQSVEGADSSSTFARFVNKFFDNVDTYDRHGFLSFEDGAIVIGQQGLATTELQYNGNAVAQVINDAQLDESFEVLDRFVLSGEFLVGTVTRTLPLTNNGAVVDSDIHIVLETSGGGSSFNIDHFKLGSRKSFKRGDIVYVSIDDYNGQLNIGHSSASPSLPTGYLAGTDALIKANATFSGGTAGVASVDCEGYGVWMFICVTEDDGAGNIIFTPTITGNLTP